MAFADLRHQLNFGVPRLKMLLALMQHPELDDDEWFGAVTFFLGQRGHVKIDVRTGNPVNTAEEITV